MNEFALHPLEQTNWPLTSWNVPARRLRASARAPGRLQQVMEAWHAELAALADLEAPLLWEKADPFGGLSIPDRVLEPATPWPDSGDNAASEMSEAKTGRQLAPLEMAGLATPEIAEESQFRNLHPSSDFPPSQEESRSSTPTASLTVWAARRRKPWLATAAHMSIGQPQEPVTPPRRRARVNAFEGRSPLTPPSGPDGAQRLTAAFARPSHRATRPPAIPLEDGPADGEVPASEREAHFALPSATGLLSRLADRWFSTRPELTARRQSHNAERAALSAWDTDAVATEPQSQPPGESEAADGSPRQPAPSGWPVRPDLALDYRRAFTLESDGRAARLQWITPIAHNTIHLTVPSPPLAQTLDPDDLADLLDRVLRQEARRYGISLI